ncbi:hypothetical protein HRbin10_02718 [bacterium HR10]|nr:hypothetical protein HRbin10_02718 [bacterium HR10]
MRRVHDPCQEEAERREAEGQEEEKRHQAEHPRGCQRNADQRRQRQQDHPLHGGERRPPQDFPQNERRAWRGRGQDRLQEARVPILDDRHHAEDRGEEDDEEHRAGEEVLQIPRAMITGAERIAQPGPHQPPEDERRSDDTQDATPLAIEANQLPMPEGGGRQKADREVHREQARLLLARKRKLDIPHLRHAPRRRSHSTVTFSSVTEGDA